MSIFSPFVRQIENKPLKYNSSSRPCNEKNIVLYRFEALIGGNDDETFDKLAIISFNVIRITKCGYVICIYGKDKFVLSGQGKRYAYHTLELAWHSFKKRCQSRKGWASLAMNRADRALSLVEKGYCCEPI